MIKKYKNKVFPRDDWDFVKDDMMLKCLRLKFNQNDHCREVLMSTGDAVLMENSPNDRYWGIGTDGKGANKLGLLLMQVKQRLRNDY